MTVTYTFDIFSTLDGYGAYGPGGNWGGYEPNETMFALGAAADPR